MSLSNIVNTSQTMNKTNLKIPWPHTKNIQEQWEELQAGLQTVWTPDRCSILYIHEKMNPANSSTVLGRVTTANKRHPNKLLWSETIEKVRNKYIKTRLSSLPKNYKLASIDKLRFTHGVWFFWPNKYHTEWTNLTRLNNDSMPQHKVHLKPFCQSKATVGAQENMTWVCNKYRNHSWYY